MRVHITRTEQYHEDVTPEQLERLEPRVPTAPDRISYSGALAFHIEDEADEWLEDVTPSVIVTVSVSEAEFRAYRERIGQPLPIPGQVDIFGQVTS